MLHTVEDLIGRLEVMKNMAIILHRKAELDDQAACKQILDDIKAMAYMIAKMESNGNVTTSMRKIYEE